MLREISAVVAKIGDTSVVCITLHPGFASVCLNVPRCKDSIGHVARAPWDMSRGLHGTCCKGSMGHVARAPWDMLQGLHGTCCKGTMGHVRAPRDKL